MKATLHQELYVRTPNETGAGRRLFASLAELGVNVVAFTGWEAGGEAHFLVILNEQWERAQKSLAAARYRVERRTAISVELANRPGSLVALLGTLAAAGIDVLHSFAAGAAGSANRTLVVLETSDNEMARHVISSIPAKA
jgi:hypothetical protein